MVPLRLRLRNFLCYREGAPVLDLTGVQVACLCGDNGHGKSALLDAITWSLWGQARARSQEELIHQGQTEMWVELEFLAGGDRYRVSRKYARGGRTRQPVTLLELYYLDGDQARPVSSGVRETQARIQGLLHMDYNTFITSAFLLQGRADRFTTMAPAERKQVLGEILGLGYYQAMEERAKARSRELERERRDAEVRVQQAEAELAHREEHQQQLDQAQQALGALGPRLEEMQQVLEQIQRSVYQLESREETRQESQRQQVQLRAEVISLAAQVQEQRLRLQQYRQAMQAAAEVEKSYARLSQARQEERRLVGLKARADALDLHRAELEGDIRVQRSKLQERLEALKGRAQEARQKGALLPEWEGELEGARKRLAVLEQRGAQQAQRQQEVLRLETEVSSLRRACDQLGQEMAELRRRMDLLAQGKGEATCPVCQSPLGAEGMERILAHYKEEGLARKEQYLAYQRRIQEQGERLGRLKREVAQEEQAMAAERRELHAAEGSLARRVQEAEEAQQSSRALEEEVGGLEALLASEGYVKEERSALQELAVGKAALGYDPGYHAQLREEMRFLEPGEAWYRELEVARRSLPEVERSLSQLEEALRQRQTALEEETARLCGLEKELSRLPALRQESGGLKEELEALQTQQVTWRDRRARAQIALERCEEMERLKGAQRRLLLRVAREKAVYEELAQAFGKGGVQALLIETAVPELEQEANRLLGRLTDGRMSLKLETQRERRTREGEPIETLEVRIADELGIRSYEMFSGGEVFRINFALRVALSKLLARRAGAPLPTLFIDEGFGTQDSAGRERLLEAIQAIQGDFKQIIVITHIEELKEAFPVRIEVTKTEAGSTFWVS